MGSQAAQTLVLLDYAWGDDNPDDLCVRDESGRSCEARKILGPTP